MRIVIFFILYSSTGVGARRRGVGYEMSRGGVQRKVERESPLIEPAPLEMLDSFRGRMRARAIFSFHRLGGLGGMSYRFPDGVFIKSGLFHMMNATILCRWVVF